MRRRTRILLSGAILALPLLLWSLGPSPVPDPVVRGRPLSAWLTERQRRPDGLPVLTDEAADAVWSLGPEAGPLLLSIISRTDPALYRGGVVLGRFLHLHKGGTATELARKRAVLGLRALGTAARPVWPALVAIALRPADDLQFRDAIDALTDADVATMRLLAGGTKSPDPQVRSRAILAFQILRIAPGEVIFPTLEALRTDPDPAIQGHVALAMTDLLNDLLQHATLLRSGDPARRVAGAQLLGSFRTRAWKYRPDLEALRNDPDPRVRAAVAEAIRLVAPPAP